MCQRDNFTFQWVKNAIYEPDACSHTVADLGQGRGGKGHLKDA